MGAKRKKKRDKAGRPDLPPATSRRAQAPWRWADNPWRVAAVVFVFSAILYANTLGHGYVWDDTQLIVDNQAVRTLDLSTIREMFTEDSWRVAGHGGGYYRPLVTLSYHVNHKVFDGNPAGFHFMNIVWNGATCVFVFFFIYLLFGDLLLGMMTSLLFAAHPIHTEAVAWISGRTDILASLWSLVSLCLYVLWRRRRRYALLLASLVSFFLALFAKESAACLPFLIVLFELRPLRALVAARSTQHARAHSTTAIAGPIFFFALLVIYIVMRQGAIDTPTSTYAAQAPGWIGRVALPFSILAGYAYKLLLPFRLSAEYDAPVPASFLEGSVIAGLLVAVLIVWAVWRFRRRPDVVLGAGILVFGLAPVMNVVPIGEVSAERFLYFPSLGFALVLGGIFSSAWSIRRKTGTPTETAGLVRWHMPRNVAGNLVVLSAVLLALFSIRTVTRNADWKNEEVLFARTAAQEPGNPRVHGNVANVAFQKGQLEKAIRSYKKSLELNPNYPIALNGLAEVYAHQGRWQEAIPLVERAIRISPDNSRLINNLGSLYYETGEYALAAEQFQKAIQMDPNNLRTHFNLGLLRLQAGDPVTARDHFRRSLEGGPDFNIANFHLAVIEEALDNPAAAKQYAQRFLAGHRANDAFRQRAEAIAGRE